MGLNARPFLLSVVVMIRFNPSAIFAIALLASPFAKAASSTNPSPLQKRWLFVWRNMNDPKEVDRMISRFPRAAAARYNGVAFSYNIPAASAAELTNAARQNHLDLIAIVMGGPKDRNYFEGVLAEGELFVVHDGRATHQPDNPTRVLNADFEEAAGNHFKGWSFQDDEGVTTFADHQVVHGEKSSLRMQDIGKNEANHCRISSPAHAPPPSPIPHLLLGKNQNPLPRRSRSKSPHIRRKIS